MSRGFIVKEELQFSGVTLRVLVVLDMVCIRGLFSFSSLCKLRIGDVNMIVNLLCGCTFELLIR